MPTITHAIIGGAIGLILFSFSQDKKVKFKAEHVILLALNCFVGPDFPKFFSPFYGDDYWTSSTYKYLSTMSHTIVGWLITAIGISLIYFLIFKQSKSARETGKAPISYVHSYLITVAGGMNHFGLDMLDSSVIVFPSFFNIDLTWSLETFMTGDLMAEGLLWDSLSWVDSKIYLGLGLLFMVILIWMLKNKPVKNVWIVAGVFGTLIFGLIYLVGSNSVENENDFGFFFYLTFAWIMPLLFCLISMDPADKTTEINDETE
jgi:hypothetical protein